MNRTQSPVQGSVAAKLGVTPDVGELSRPNGQLSCIRCNSVAPGDTIVVTAFGRWLPHSVQGHTGTNNSTELMEDGGIRVHVV